MQTFQNCEETLTTALSTFSSPRGSFANRSTLILSAQGSKAMERCTLISHFDINFEVEKQKPLQLFFLAVSWIFLSHFEVWHLLFKNETNQMIEFSAFIQSRFRGTRYHFTIKLVCFSVLGNKRGSLFSVLLIPCNKSFIDQASSVKMVGCWRSSLFAKKRTRPTSSHPDLALDQ